MAEQGTTRIEAGRLLAQPGAEPAQGPCILSIAEGRIQSIDAAPPGAGKGLMALPALVDAHDHGRGQRTVAFGAGDDCLELWISRLGREPKVDPYLRAAVAFGRMAEGGIAAANHCHNAQDPDALVEEAEAVSRAARDVGVRIAFAVPFMDRNPLVYGDPEPVLAQLSEADRARLVARSRKPRPFADQIAAVEAITAFEHDCFNVQYGPVGPQWVSDAALEAIAEASARTGRRIHMHMFETRYQKEWAAAEYPGGLAKQLDAIGFLSPRLTLAHGIWLDEQDRALMAERGVTVSVNTSSNLRLKSGIAPVGGFIDADLTFGMGMDGMAFDDDEDALRELRLLWQLHRGIGVERVLTQERLFRAVMADGRRSIVGDDGGGALTPGAPADLMLLDEAAMGSDILPGAIGPLDLLLTRATKAHIDRLVVGGRTIVRGGACTSIDLPALTGEMEAQAKAAWATREPDDGATDRISAAIAGYYGCGHHRASPKTRTAE